MKRSAVIPSTNTMPRPTGLPVSSQRTRFAYAKLAKSTTSTAFPISLGARSPVIRRSRSEH